MNLDYTALRFWIDIGQTLATVAIGVYVWWDKYKLKTASRIDRLEAWKVAREPVITGLLEDMRKRNEQYARHRGRTEQLERDYKEVVTDIRHLPDKDAVIQLTQQIGSLSTRLGELKGKLDGVDHIVELLNEHHLRDSK